MLPVTAIPVAQRGVYNLRDFGARLNGDSLTPTDDTAKLLLALDKVKSNRSGVLKIDGPVYIGTPNSAFDGLVGGTNGVDLTIEGIGIRSRFIPAQGLAGHVLSFQNLNSLVLRNFGVMSRAPEGGSTDGTCIFRTHTNVKHTHFDHLHFYGLKINTANGGVIEPLGKCAISYSKFYGCTSMLAAVVECATSEGLYIHDTDFIDHGSWEGTLYTKTGAQAQQWIRVRGVHGYDRHGEPDASDNMSSLKAITLHFRRLSMDEGAKRGIWIDPDLTYPMGKPMSVIIEEIGLNGSVGGAVGFDIRNCFHVRIRNCWEGYAAVAGTAINLQGVEIAELDHVFADGSAMNTLIWDAATRVYARGCRFDTLTGPLDRLTWEDKDIRTERRATAFSDFRAPNPPVTGKAGYVNKVIDETTGKMELRALTSGNPSSLRAKLKAAWDFTGTTTRKDKIAELLGNVATPLDLTTPDGNPSEITGLLGKAAQFNRATNLSLAVAAIYNSDPRIQLPTNDHSFIYLIGKMKTGSLVTTGNTHVIMCKYTGAGAFEYNFQKSNQAPFKMRFIVNGVIAEDPWVPVEDLYFLAILKYTHDAVTPGNRKIGIKIIPYGSSPVFPVTFTETVLSAGPLASSGRLAFGRQGNSATNYADVVIDEAGIGDGAITDQEIQHLWNNGGLLGWPLEVGEGRLYSGDAIVEATALGSKTHSIPIYRTDGTILCWVDGKARP